MNKQRRKSLAEIEEQPQTLRDELEQLLEEEQEYYDNMPEGIQMSERGERADEAITNMGNAMGCLEEACECIQEAMA